MAEGHPCFVATNGRIGFSADDLAAYSPEAGADVRPLWAAVPKDVSHLSHSDQLDEERAYRLALGDAQFSSASPIGPAGGVRRGFKGATPPSRLWGSLAAGGWGRKSRTSLQT